MIPNFSYPVFLRLRNGRRKKTKKRRNRWRKMVAIKLTEGTWGSMDLEESLSMILSVTNLFYAFVIQVGVRNHLYIFLSKYYFQELNRFRRNVSGTFTYSYWLFTLCKFRYLDSLAVNDEHSFKWWCFPISLQEVVLGGWFVVAVVLAAQKQKVYPVFLFCFICCIRFFYSRLVLYLNFGLARTCRRYRYTIFFLGCNR